MPRNLLSFVLPALLLVPACSGGSSPIQIAQSEQQRDTSPSVPAANVQSAAQSEEAFGVDLYAQLVTGKQNLFFSPHSIIEALAMTYAGAAGTTATQMHDVLHLTLPDSQVHAAMNALDLALASRAKGQPGQDGKPFALNVVNAIWGQTGFAFEPAYLDTIAINYGAGLRLLDFAHAADPSRVTINDWVADQTANKITNLLPQGSITDGTRLVLTNAVYFNASWASSFDASKTTNETFTKLDGTQASIPTMLQQSEGYTYYQGTGVTAVSLPYAGNQLSMIVIRPDDFASYAPTFNVAALDAIIAGLKSGTVTLHLPKWSFTDTNALSTSLQALGMVDAFKLPPADFSGIDGQKDLYISDVLHKAFVSVDESGTEAAAATAVILGTADVEGGPPIDVKIDRTFLFLIRDDATGAIVFFGRVADPTAS